MCFSNLSINLSNISIIIQIIKIQEEYACVTITGDKSIAYKAKHFIAETTLN